ncbi:MAG: response regulator [Candidatus Omnitrophota bacterium]|jgi:CheY-like chemotaxis protein
MAHKILIVDDEEDVCRFTKSILEKTGKFEVTFLTQAFGIVGFVKNFQPDLILLDIMLPEKDGTEIAAELSNEPEIKNIPIVFLTALAQRVEVENNAGKIGGWDILAKPISTKDLISKIETILQKHP